MEVILKIKIDEKNLNFKENSIFIPEAAQSYWDDIEIHAVKEIEIGIYETTEEGEEDFWSVYLHQLEGGLKCIADLKTKKSAEKLAKLIWNAANYRVYSKFS